jgi:hypothetical protein
VEFVPASAGTTSGSLTAGSSALATGASVPLAGMGFDFSVTLSGSSSQTISSGQTAGYTLVITPLNGSSGSFTLACASLPSDSTCTFNPASESIPANTTGNEQVEIATGQSTSSAHLVRSSAWPVLSLACGLLLVPVAFRRRRRALLLVVLLALLAGGVSSCTSSGIISGSSGGAGGHTTTGTTAAGTYSIPITVTSNGVQHQVTLTLTVD